MLDGIAASCAFDVGCHAGYVVYAGGLWSLLVGRLFVSKSRWCRAALYSVVYGELSL
jgi:hypothetical protein